jgi:hypothetical protein
MALTLLPITDMQDSLMCLKEKNTILTYTSYINYMMLSKQYTLNILKNLKKDVPIII